MGGIVTQYLFVLSSQVGVENLDSSGSATYTQAVAGLEHSRSLKELYLIDLLSASMGGISTSRLIERDSPYSAVDFGVAKALSGYVEVSEWQRKPKQYSGEGRNQFPSSSSVTDRYNRSHEHEHQSPRALIDAYGRDKRKEISSSKPLLVEPMDINGIEDEVLPTSWHNTEEQEFDWEDINPTLIDNHSKNSYLLPSTVVAANATLSEQDAGKGGLSSGSLLPPLDDSSALPNETAASASISVGESFRGAPLGQVPGFQNQIKHSVVSPQSHDACKISHHPSNLSQHIFRKRERARSDTIPPTNKIPYLVQHAVRMVFGLVSGDQVRPSVLPVSFKTKTPMEKHVKSQFEPIHTSNATVNHVVNKSWFIPEQSFNSVENKDANTYKVHQLPNILPGLISSNQQAQFQVFQSTSQFIHGSCLQGHGALISTTMSNPLPVMQPVGYTNLISSLMSQGVIVLPNQLLAQDSIGTEFNRDILKVRHECVVKGLYGDLPRQCETCGLRFKGQKEHSSHMDWHVTKNRNRISKSHKQKLKPSRKWFLSEKMWFSAAEALGTESVPRFMLSETTEEEKDDVELAVAAEDEQKTCALCGEPFDEFYSDEMEEWMYRGAAYLYAPTGTITAGIDRSQLGPIIHAKCRSESNMQCADRKRLRT
ncbi:hypothetical protein VNO78_19325 [Psophocarpus tetragonolobus]|uniref:C2H2-type domain-containing protein n=1 Tax=Psophocarpus tetragonolobus TaxID=3891 RepID=A0AAN9SBU9_PSOTE